ncbi:unnamed protein product [Triticum turgidum subsp. durum]|uniref:J domain-containing protein n=1 Tax=Triticum turgidum subsp. durum TaxID=4567 RepID=A0A9R0R069_TRITD|nr:unnamed protein product [Triticum turgidum subsp. durum]
MGNPPELYYQLLNITRDTPPQEIRAAYRCLVRQWHPDKHPPSSKSEAEDRLSWTSRKTGRCSGRATPTRAGGAALGPRSALAAARRHYVVRKAPPLERKVECTLEELCAGCKKEVKYTRDVVTKNGLIAKKEVTQIIRVKPGWKKGTKVTFEGMGNERPGCLPGDAVFTVSARRHKAFKRQGDDLVLKAEVPLVSALTGWSFSFRLLGGEKVSWSFRDEVIRPGYEKVVRGEGMPVVGGKKGARGDLRVKFDVVFPKNLTGEQRRGLVEILRGCA